MDGFLRGMSRRKAASEAAGAVEAIALYGFRREGDNYARAASLLPLQAALEMKLPPWATDRNFPGALAFPWSKQYGHQARLSLHASKAWRRVLFACSVWSICAE